MTIWENGISVLKSVMSGIWEFIIAHEEIEIFFWAFVVLTIASIFLGVILTVAGRNK